MQVLNLTAPSMAGGGVAEALQVEGCSSVTLAFPPLQQLRALLVRNCASATFQERASPLLRHLALFNVSQLALRGQIFQSAGLETVLFDGVRVSTLPTGAFSNLSQIHNVTFRDVHFNAVQQGAMELNMVNNSELTILRSKLLGIEKSGIVVKGVANFTMHESTLTTVGDNGLELDAAGPVSIEDSQLQTAGPVKLTITTSASFRFVNNVWRNSSLLNLAEQFLFSGIKPTLRGNTFHCACDPTVASLVTVGEAVPLLESNRCDEGLCGSPVPMRVLTSCRSEAELQAGSLQAACKAALPAGATTVTVPAKASTPAIVTGSPRAAKPLSPGTNSKSKATATAISVTTALLLVVPAAVAQAL